MSSGETAHISIQFTPPVLIAKTTVAESVVCLALIPLKSSLQKLLSRKTFSMVFLEDWEGVSKFQSPSCRAVLFILGANWIFFFFDVTFVFDPEI